MKSQPVVIHSLNHTSMQICIMPLHSCSRDVQTVVWSSPAGTGAYRAPKQPVSPGQLKQHSRRGRPCCKACRGRLHGRRAAAAQLHWGACGSRSGITKAFEALGRAGGPRTLASGGHGAGHRRDQGRGRCRAASAAAAGDDRLARAFTAPTPARHLLAPPAPEASIGGEHPRV